MIYLWSANLGLNVLNILVESAYTGIKMCITGTAWKTLPQQMVEAENNYHINLVTVSHFVYRVVIESDSGAFYVLFVTKYELCYVFVLTFCWNKVEQFPGGQV